MTLQLLAPAECYHTQSCLFNTHWWGEPHSQISALDEVLVLHFLFSGSRFQFFFQFSADSLLFRFFFSIFIPHLSLSALLSNLLLFPFFPLLFCIKVSQRSKYRLKAYILTLQSHCMCVRNEMAFDILRGFLTC